MAIANQVRKGFYLDSVALMRIQRALTALPGVEEAGLMIGTPANKQIMRDARVLADAGEAAGPGDLVIGVRAKDAAAAEAALVDAARQLDAPRGVAGAGAAWRPRTLRAAQQQMADASLALISVPGDFAIAEARKAINRGLDVMIFSDNVPLADEVELKREARALGRLVMGPDCGTAIIGGVPLAFANVVPRGDIGIIGASGTGIQEISCLIARAGRGISHAIGTGGRDLKAEVGGITTLMAIEMLDADPATKHIVLVSKPPAPAVAKAVLARIGKSAKPYTVCFLGGDGAGMPGNATFALLLDDAARLAVGRPISRSKGWREPLKARKGLVRGLFSGGSLCAEAQVVFRNAGVAAASNAAIPGVSAFDKSWTGHTLLDLGEDEFTRGKPHPMIEPSVRDVWLHEARKHPDTAVVLIDVVLGYGGHADPAGHLARALKLSDRDAYIVASVTGTDGDPQGFAGQVRILEDAGVLVAESNAAAARIALDLIKTTD